MSNRPFYELDDDEIILEEATTAALSQSAVKPPTQTSEPSLVLYANITPQILERLNAIADNDSLTLLDHAIVFNLCACTLDVQDKDRFGLSNILRSDAALLSLDRARATHSPRSDTQVGVNEAIKALLATPLYHDAPQTGRLSIRLDADSLLGLRSLQSEPSTFFVIRRLSLALLPTLTRLETTADIARDYVMSARVFFNRAAARQPLSPWAALATSTSEDTDQYARSFIQALHKEIQA